MAAQAGAGAVAARVRSARESGGGGGGANARATARSGEGVAQAAAAAGRAGGRCSGQGGGGGGARGGGGAVAPSPWAASVRLGARHSPGSDTWRQVIGLLEAQGRFMDLEEGGGAVARAIAARREAVEEMRCMVQGARAAASGTTMGAASPDATGWHDLPWTVGHCMHAMLPSCHGPWVVACCRGLIERGLFSPSFGEALQRAESVEVVLRLWRILQGRHGGRDGNPAATWLPAGPEWAEDEVPRRVLNDIVHVDVVGDHCLIWSTDRGVCSRVCSAYTATCAATHLPTCTTARCTSTAPPRPACACRPSSLTATCSGGEHPPVGLLPLIRWRLCSFAPIALPIRNPPFIPRFVSLIASTPQPPPSLPFSPPSPSRSALPTTSADVSDTAAGVSATSADVVTPPKFIALQPAVALTLLARGGGALAASLSHLPFEVNAEERAAIHCPSSLVVHGRSGTGKTTVIIHRALHLHRLSSTRPLASPPAHGGTGMWGTVSGDGWSMGEGGVGDGTGVLRQVVVTRSLQLCASIQADITHASESLAALESAHLASQPSADLHSSTEQQVAPQQQQQPAPQVPPPPTGGGSASSSSAQRQHRRYMLLMQEDLEASLMGSLPSCIAAIPPTAFPLALTLSKLLRLLDASVTRPFLRATQRQRAREVARRRMVVAIEMSAHGVREAWEQEEGGRAWGGHVEKERWEARSGGAWGWGRGASEHSRGGRREGLWDEWRQQTDEEVTAGEEEEQEEEEEVEVDYHIAHQGQPARLAGTAAGPAGQQGQQGSRASAASRASSSSTGHVVVGEEEYVRGMVGSNERTSPMGERDRRAVYRLFQAYERRKRRRGEYDSADLVLHLHQEIRRMQQRQEPWWSVDHALPSPPWAIPGSTTTGLHRTPPASTPSAPWSASCSGPCAAVFHCVSVDEVQDLTQAQLALLPLLCANVASGFVLAGDTAQSIAHGVDFRFEDLARVVYSEFLHKGDELGRIASTVVRLLRAFFPAAIDRLHAETSMVDGAVPVMACVAPEWKMHLAQGMPLSATQAIIVRSSEEKRRLLALFAAKPVVLTVEECKGLEFQHMDAARCYQKLGQFAEAADCYSAGGDMHSALLVCLRARIFQKGLSLLDTWQPPASTSAAAVQEAQRVEQLRGWYVVECARWHERQREYDRMLSFIRLHHCLPTKRAFLEAGRHLRQLATLEDEQGDKSRVPRLLQRAGALLEAAQYLWQQGSPGRALVCFVRHLHCRLNAAGRGALRVGMRKRAAERGRCGGGAEMSAEEVEMAGRLWAVERWSFAERDACGASDLAWARVEMSVLLLVMAHDVAIDTDSDSDSDDAAAAAAVRGDDGDGCQAAVGAGARLSRAWMAVRQGQAVPADLVGKCTGAAGAEAGNGSGGRGGEGGRDGASGGIAVWWTAVNVGEEEREEAEEMWQGRDVLRKGREQMEREKKRGVAGGLGVEEVGSEWKGAEQVRAEVLLACAGVQVCVRMLQCAQDHLSSWLAHFHSALSSSSHHVCSPPPTTPSTAATPASPSASPSAASTTSAARVVAAPAEEAAVRQVGQETCTPPPPPIGPLQQKAALWFYRWLSRLSSLLSALRHLHALPAAGPHLPRLHAAFSLLSCSFHRHALTSCCQVDDVSLPWVPRGDVQRVASSGASGEMEGRRAVEVVESAWEREYVTRWREAQHVARTGGVDCSSRLLSCLQQVLRASTLNASTHASATPRTPVTAHAPPSPHAALLNFLPLTEHSLSLLPVTMLSCSRSAILPSHAATPLHHLFSSLLLHPLPTNRASPPTRDDHKPARPCWPHHMCHSLLHPTLAALLLHDLPAQGQATRAYDSSKAGGSRQGRGWGAGEVSRGEGRGSDARAGDASHGSFALGRAVQAAADAPVPAGQSCWQGDVDVTAEDAWGITLLFLTYMLNQHPYSGGSRDKDWGLVELEARMRVAYVRGNPLMAPSIAGFTHALSARALLHQASPLPNVHGDSGRLLHFPWKSSLLPLAPSLAPVPAIPLLPHPPAAIFNVSPPFASLLFDLLRHLLPTLRAMWARGEVPGGPGRMGGSECGEAMCAWEMMRAFDEFGMAMVEIAPSQFQAFWKRFPETVGRSGKV
ncbi:unnamed protein product [Closterium sp. Yama58-4]|nr:unnamed protein product [Closterium sp. Yama58-4]